MALTPAAVKALKDAGWGRVLVQSGAGTGSSASDAEYAAAGAELTPDAAATLTPADVVVKVRPPDPGAEVPLLREGATLVSYVQPASNAALLDALAARRATVLALDCIPRTLSRAQVFDTLSSQANVAGHRAALEAAHAFGRLIPAQSTAAGRVPPAHALVIGGGVAGLAAAGCARSLGAVVKIFDTRAAVEEQAKSMGCEFVGGPAIMQGEAGEGKGGYAASASEGLIARERALFESLAPTTDLLISTALVPGQTAPVLVTAAALDAMRPGSVVVDLAAEAGGNVEGTVAGRAVTTSGGVTIIGYTDLPSRLAPQVGEEGRERGERGDGERPDPTPPCAPPLIFSLSHFPPPLFFPSRPRPCSPTTSKTFSCRSAPSPPAPRATGTWTRAMPPSGAPSSSGRGP